MPRSLRVPSTCAIAVAGALLLVGCGDDARTQASGTPLGGRQAGTPASTALAAQKKSPDSDAPATAPAHWLPPEAWVYNHWLPYDESRLYSVLKITREQLWAQLRDDHRTLAELAAKHGYPDPAKLAADLVAPRAKQLGPQRTAQLQARAVRTITQGHLAQHLFFHSLHQFAIPSAAPDIFGVTDATFRELRRQELSPLQIGRLQGRSPGAIEADAIAVLEERARTGVSGGAMSRRQADLLLRRQLTQLPRWLDQARYNGPPPTHRGNLVAKPKDYSSNPAISADGRFVAYEAYRQKLPLAVKLGEIAVMRADLKTGRNRLVSPIPGKGTGGPNPISAYNPVITGDGRRVAYESSAGNQNFAKRYGRIGTRVTDMRTARTSPLGAVVRDVPDSQSTFNPDLAAGGGTAIYEAVRSARTLVVARDLARGRESVVVRGARAGGARFRDPYEATVSADGTVVAYTLAEGAVREPGSARSSIRVRDLRHGRTILVSRADGRTGKPLTGFSADPALSPDGRYVAFTSTAPELGVRKGTSGLFLRDLVRGTTRRLDDGQARPLDPVVARGARAVAYTSVGGRGARILAWAAADGATTLVSRTPAGKPAGGFSGDPSISADGRHVAFASTATDLEAKAGDGTRAIYAWSRGDAAVRRISDPEVAYAGHTLPAAPPPPTPAASDAPAAPPADEDDGPDTVFVTDNAFVDGGQRPVLHVTPNTEVTWRWRSKQSHSVLLRSGPARFRSKVRQQGAYRHRFHEAGTYELVCSLHAPGMKMTVVVDPAS